MNASLLADAYRALRAEGYTPAQAVEGARLKGPTSYVEVEGGVQVEMAPFTVVISAVPDPDASFELGHFVDAVHPSVRGNVIDLGKRSPGFRYFLPQTTYAEHRHSLSAMGYSRGVADQLARRYVREDMLTELGIAFPAFTVTVSVRISRFELGVDAVGAVVFEDGGIRTPQDLIDYVWREGMIHRAMDRSEPALEDLRTAAGLLGIVRSN